jgi:hypothetical protein
MPMGDSNWYYVDGMQNYIWVVLYITAEREKGGGREEIE